MDARTVRAVALITALVVLAHAILAFTKMRWVTGLLEVVAAAVIVWQWRLLGQPRSTS
jgi:hypothetical protein